MVRTTGRFGWQAAAVLGVCVLSAGLARADDDDAAECVAAYTKGRALQEKGQLKEAAASYEQALPLALRAFGEDEHTAAILGRLARIYQSMGQYAKAEPLYLRNLRIQEDKLGKDDPDVADTLNGLAALYAARGQYDKAEPLYHVSLKIREDKLGKDHPDVAQSLNNLGFLYKEMGQYAKAEPLYLRSLKIEEDKLGKDDPYVADSLNNLGELYRATGQYEKAEPLYLRGLKIWEDKLGKDHPNVAGILNNLATLYVATRQYEKAEPLYQRSLKIREDKLGKEHPLVAQSLNNLAVLYKEMGQYAKAEPLYQRSLQIREAKLDKDHPDLVQSLNNLASLYDAMGLYPGAEPLYLRTLKIKEDKLGKDHPDLANSINNLANLYKDMSQYEKAEPLYQRILKIQEDKLGKDQPDVAESLNNLAVLYDAMGQYDKAEPLYLRGLKIDEDKFGKDHPNVAATLNNLGSLYYHMGQYAKAEPLCLRALKINEDKLGKDHREVAVSLNNLAELYSMTGRYGQAEPLLQRSLQIQEEKFGKDQPEAANSINNLASLYQAMGQYDKAEPLYQRSLKIREVKFGKDHPDVAASLNNLASLYQAMGQYAKAEPLYQRSLQIREDNLGKDHPDVAQSLDNLGTLYLIMDQDAKAEPLLQRSLQIREDRLGKDHPYVATSLNSMALLYVDMDQYEKAEPLYLRSLKIWEERLGKDAPDVAMIHRNLAFLYAYMRRWQEAAEEADRASRIIRRHVARLLPSQPEKEQLAFLEHHYKGSFHAFESLALWRRGDSATVALSAGWVLNGKALAHEALAQRALAALDAKDPAAAELSQKLLGVRSRMAALTQAPAQPGQEDQRRQERDELAEQEKDLAERLAKADGRSVRAEPWEELAEVRKALPADAVLIEVSRFHDLNVEGKDKKSLGFRYAAWVIPPQDQGEVQIIDLGEADAIEDAVKAVRQAFKDAQGSPKHPSTITQDGEPDAEKELLKPLQALSKLVLGPLAEHIDGKKRWYVSPDAALWLVPWAALPLKDGRYAVEAHTISYLVSGRDLAAAPSQAKPGRSRMMADPNYDLGVAEARAATVDLIGKTEGPDPPLRGVSPSLGRQRAPRLPGTAAEAKAIKPALEKYAGEEAGLYQQDKALEGVFKTFRGPRVLMLSTHGFFLQDQEVAASDKGGLQDEKRPALDKQGKPLENPLLRCGLLLAGCNNRDQAQEGDEDGVLTGLEVVGTDLRGTELVVLSACETGLGDVHNGEGVAGLRQAFELAGARSVAATLWQVPDRESAKLMSDFFANLAKAKDKAEALRDAQLAMIKTRRDKNAAAHPFFWAAYTLTGQ